MHRIELLSPKCKCSQMSVIVMLVFTIYLLPREVWSWTGGVSTNTATVTLQHRGVTFVLEEGVMATLISLSVELSNNLHEVYSRIITEKASTGPSPE